MTAPWMRTPPWVKRPRRVETPEPAPQSDDRETDELVRALTPDSPVPQPQRIASGNPHADPTRCCDHGELITDLIGQLREVRAELAAMAKEIGVTP